MRMTKGQVIGALAQRTGLKKTQIDLVLDELAKLAYAEAKNGFVIPGIGKLMLAHRPPRTGRHPGTGEPIDIPAKTVVNFRVAKACKDSVQSE